MRKRNAKELYLAVRRIKREVMFKNPAVDFSQMLFIDQPMPQGSESTHEAVHRLGMMAVPGGRLLVLDGLDPGGKVRSLGPESRAVSGVPSFRSMPGKSSSASSRRTEKVFTFTR